MILYDIYEFTFMAIDKYKRACPDEEKDNNQIKDVYHYLIEINQGFNVFNFNWIKKADEYLKINTLYRGFGRLSTCGNVALYNHNIDQEAIKRIQCTGILEKVQINWLLRDGYDYIAPKDENTDYISGYGYCYDDILHNIGYPEDMLKFQTIISKYQDDDSSFESTGQNKSSHSLVYTIRMV